MPEEVESVGCGDRKQCEKSEDPMASPPEPEGAKNESNDDAPVDEDALCTTLSRTSSTCSTQHLSPEQWREISKPWTQNAAFKSSTTSVSSTRPGIVPVLELKSPGQKMVDGLDVMISNIHNDIEEYGSMIKKETKKLSGDFQNIATGVSNLASSQAESIVTDFQTKALSLLARGLLPTIGIFHVSNC